MMASLFAISITINWFQAATLDAQAIAILNNSKEFYASLFPEEGVQLMKRSFGQHLKDSSGSNSGGGDVTFSSLLGSVGQVIYKDASLIIDSIRYTSNKKTLELNLTVSSITKLDALKKQLSDLNLLTEIASANQDGDKIKGLLKVSKNG